MPPPEEDSAPTRTLLEEVRSGRSDALDQLLQRHRDFILRFAQLRLDPLLRARIDPSDVVQEAQMEAARRIDAYLQQRSLPFRLWLRQLTYDRLLMLRREHLHAEKRSVRREEVLPAQSSQALAGQLLARGSSPSQRIHRNEIGRRVQQALASLSESDREIVLMRNYEGLSNREVARLLGIEPATASQRYGRALLRLRNILLSEEN